jgi:plastocyanin
MTTTTGDGGKVGYSWYRVLTVVVLLAACSAGEEAIEQDIPGEHTVVIRMTDEMKFVPEQPTLSVGDTVVWINEGSMPHTATDKPGTAGLDEHNVLPEGAEAWDSGLLESGQTYSRVFTTAGDYTYLCFLHEAAGMIGRLTVQKQGRSYAPSWTDARPAAPIAGTILSGGVCCFGKPPQHIVQRRFAQLLQFVANAQRRLLQIDQAA